MSLSVGMHLGPYEILGAIGAGGMGEVYKARDMRLDRTIAIKILTEHLSKDPHGVARFKRELRAIAALSHPNIMALYDVGNEGGIDYAVTELLEGETLRTRLAGGALSSQRAVAIGAEVADGLAAAHAKGIVHRDLKPENIFISFDGRAKILDFGLARHAWPATPEEQAVASTQTEPGNLVGTIGYMSPEQVRGEAAGTASDIFSFGCVLYEMVSGRRAFARATKAETLAAILRDEPPQTKPGIELDAIIVRCLEKRPDRRFQSAQDLAFALHGIRGRTPARVSRRALAASAGGVVLAAGAASYWIGIQGRTSIDSLAILPFMNANGDPNSEYLSEGISESLITGLSRVPRLRVKSRDATFRYKGQDKDVQLVGRELNVRAVLKGRLMQRGNALSISAELIDTKDGTLLWRDQYDRTLANMLGIEHEIVKEISQQLKSTPRGEGQPVAATSSTRNPEAYQLYLKGRFYWNQRLEEPVKKAVEYYQLAIEKDPGYARAWAGLADAFVVLGNYSLTQGSEAFPRAKAAAERAIELEETLAEPHAALAWMKTCYEWDWPAAEKGYRRALELNPEYGTAHHWYACHLVTMGRDSEAIIEIRRARELEPLSPIVNCHVGLVYFFARQYNKAAEEMRRAIEVDPQFWDSHISLGMIYAVEGKQKEAIAEIELGLRFSGGNPVALSLGGCSYGFLRRSGEARKLLNELSDRARHRYVAPQMLGMIYAGMGEKDRAVDLFQRTVANYADRGVAPFWLRNPLIDGMRSAARFQSLLRRMGLRDLAIQ